MITIRYCTNHCTNHALRSAAHTIKYTSHFNLSSAEIDLLVDALDEVCQNYSASKTH
jgi:hypothetical protein